MTPKVIHELAETVRDSDGMPVEIEDPQTRQVYVVMSRAEFRRLVYDDSDLTEAEMQAAAGGALSDADGWGSDSDYPDSAGSA